MIRKTLAAGAVTALAVPAAASAHVTVQPNTATPGGFTVENIRVPNEKESGNTVKIQVKMPPGFAEALWQQVPGWRATVKKTKLAKPIQTDDGPVTEQVSEITFSGGKIPPGAFQDFPLSVQIPDGKVGAKLTFKAVQTYDDGETVSWIGAPDSDTPAPQVTLVASGADAPQSAPLGSVTAEVVKEKTNNTGKTLAIVALALAAVALASGLRPRRG